MAADDEALLAEARAMTNAASADGIHLRLLGAMAVYFRSEEWRDLAERLKRLGEAGRRFTDLDFAAYGAERAKVRALFEDRFGLVADPQAMLFHGKQRLLYAHPSKEYHVDVFFDRLQFSHTIELGRPGHGRLDRDSPTMTPADLLLSKIQIHRVTEKDLKDAILLIRATGLSPTGNDDAISVPGIIETLAADWGFWKDATANLEEIRRAAARYGNGQILGPADVEAVSRSVDSLLQAIEHAPKSRSWLRGQRKLAGRQWWDDVEAVIR